MTIGLLLLEVETHLEGRGAGMLENGGCSREILPQPQFALHNFGGTTRREKPRVQAASPTVDPRSSAFGRNLSFLVNLGKTLASRLP